MAKKSPIEYYGYTMQTANNTRLLEDVKPHIGKCGDDQMRRGSIIGPSYVEGLQSPHIMRRVHLHPTYATGK